MILINAFHLLFIAPLFSYVGYMSQKPVVQDTAYNIIASLALVVLGYHGYKYWITGWWINLLHILIAFTLLGMSINRVKNSKIWYGLAGLVAILHLILLIRKLL